jgi:hypothetical protein
MLINRLRFLSNYIIFLLIAMNLSLFFTSCKSIDEEVTMDDHLAHLMDNREYKEVITTIDSLPESERGKPKLVLYRAQAFSGLAGIDAVSLTKLVGRLMDFQALERAYGKLLKMDKVAGEKTPGHIVFTKAVVAYAGYLKVLDAFPDVSQSARPLLMESLLALQGVSESDALYYKRARTQSFMLHSTIVVAAVKSAIRREIIVTDGQDLLCYIDAAKFSSDLPWMLEHLSGALDDAEFVRSKLSEAKGGFTNLVAIRERIKVLMADTKLTSPIAISLQISQLQSSLQCND